VAFARRSAAALSFGIGGFSLLPQA